MARVAWLVDRNTEDSEVAPVEGCSHHTLRKESSPRPKNNSHHMNRTIYSSLMIIRTDCGCLYRLGAH
jgi:hypothetical protein